MPPTRRKPARLLIGLALGVACLAIAAVMAMFLFSADPQQELAAEETTPPRAADCLRLSQAKFDYFSQDAMERAIERRIIACRDAHRAAPDDPQIKVALGIALRMDDRTEKVALFRAAAAQGNAEANYQLYEHHKSWDRHSDRPIQVTRAEAEAGLRRAAELGHPHATFILTVLLDRGSTLRRDATEARLWAARAAESPPADVPRGTILVLLGRLQSQSDQPDERTRGHDLLEQLSAQRASYNAATALAEAIRADDPVRARSLLESAMRPDPGGATTPLADMLIKGEGGAADPARALKLLRATNEIGAIHGALGQIYLKGELVPRDVAKAIDLMRHAGVWNVDARIQVMQLLSVHPEVRIDRPQYLRYDAIEAAELGEPGGLAAAIALFLSEHAQFKDHDLGCRLVRLARERGDDVTDTAKAACPAQ